MIFTRANIEKIRRGVKTETRRIWKVPHVKVGGIYRVRFSRRFPPHPSDPRIHVTRLFREPLGAVEAYEDGPSNAVKREGCVSAFEFREEWIQLHGHWDPQQVVTVVQFEVV